MTTVYPILPILSTLLFGSFAGFVIFHRPRTDPKFLLGILWVETFVWQAAWALSFFSSNALYLNLLSKLAYTFILFLPFTFYHFTVVFLGLNPQKNLIPIFYLCCTPFLLILWVSNFFITGYRPFFWGYYASAGPIHPLYLGLSLFALIRSIVLLYKAFRKKIPVTAPPNQIKYIFLALGIYFFAAIDYAPVYGMPVYPFGVVFLLASFLIITYAITRHRLLDIEVIIKKTLVFAGLFGMVISTVVLVTSFTQTYLGRLLSMGTTSSMILSGLIVIVLYDPARKWLIQATNKYLFQKKEDVKNILNKLSHEIIAILDLQKVGERVLSTLRETMQLESGAILIKDEDGRQYRVLDTFGMEGNGLAFKNDNPMIRYFIAQRPELINLENPHEAEGLSNDIQESLQKLKTRVCLPLFLSGELIGALILGKKKSDQEYSAEEIDFFPTISSQTAVALSNARLVAILNKSRLEFAQQAKMASIGILSQGINHQIRNPLTVIKGKAQVMKMNLRDGVYADKTKEEIIALFQDLASVAIENANRASDIMVRLSSLARPAKGDAYQEVDLKKQLEEILPFVEKQLELNNIELQVEVPSDLPHVLADGKQIGEVFLNLLNNAYQAILQKDKDEKRLSGEMIGKIHVTAKKEKDSVMIHFQDTGIGIPASKIDDIFTPFYTTKEDARTHDSSAVTGTGLGLHVCRQILDYNQAKMQVESREGLGSTFTVIFTRLVRVKQSRRVG